MTNYYEYHAVLDRVFQSGGRLSLTTLAKEHGWGRARFVRAVDELVFAGMVDMREEKNGAIISHKPFATRRGIVSLLNLNGESYEAIVEYIVNGTPVYKVDAPYHDYTGWKTRGIRDTQELPKIVE